MIIHSICFFDYISKDGQYGIVGKYCHTNGSFYESKKVNALRGEYLLFYRVQGLLEHVCVSCLMGGRFVRRSQEKNRQVGLEPIAAKVLRLDLLVGLLYWPV